ncbi:MAG TPA: PAS domain S-box protein [Kofleriaceae bacterium]
MYVAVRKRRAYAAGVAITVATIALLHVVFRPEVAPVIQLLLPAVVVAAYLGGVGPGLTTTVFATFIGGVVLRPWANTDPTHVTELLRVGAFATIGAMISVLFEALHRSNRREARSNEKLIHSDRRFMRAFNSSPIAHAVSRISDRCVVDVNDAYLKVFGIERSDIIGRTPASAGVLVAPKDRDRMLAQLRSHGEIRDVEVEVPTMSGPIRTVLLTSQLVEIEGETYAMSMFVDVTARRNAERDAREQAERFMQFATAVRDAFWLRDPTNMRILYISPAFDEIFGRSGRDVYEISQSWMDAVHPDDLERVKDAQPKQLLGTYDEQFRIVHPNGDVRWLRSKAFTVKNDNGEVVRIAGITTDVTEQRALEHQLRQTQKLESVGLMAGGIAHDFNNLLNVIVSNTDMLRDDLATPVHKEMLDEIDAAVSRAAGMTRQLLAFSRKQPQDAVVLDLNRVVEDTRKMLRRLMGADIAIRVSLDPEVGNVRFDSSQLVQVLMNLAVNARDAMENGGTLRLESRKDGSSAVLVVGDTGSGMTPAVLARVFEPFFTTKDVGRGTGLGLAVVHGIVEQAGGSIAVESEPDVGTTFTITLPTVAEAVEASNTSSVVVCRGTERILLVDDDWHVRNAAARALRSRGYTVHEAENGRAALRILDDRAIDILVTDVVMPGMDGRRLFEAAHRRRPELPVLFMSGYTDDEVVHRGVQAAELAFLEKPFRVQALAAKVRQVLDDKPA